VRLHAALLCCVLALLLLAATSARADAPSPIVIRALHTFAPQPTNEAKLERRVRRLRRENRRLHRHLAGYGRWVRSLQRTLRHDPDVGEAIELAATTYGVPSATLWRKARCESGLDPRNKNPGSTASGLFQFLTSTWASTPFGGFSIWSPYANALAAGWMHANGRGGEWVCR
jgi:hypothetical protein